MSDKNPQPINIKLHKKSRTLDLYYDDGTHFELSCEYLRVFSPSAEVQGHGPGQEVLQIGKENVNITEIEPVGNYAVKLVFDDNHSTGIYSWSYLYDLGINYIDNSKKYLDNLKKAGHPRKQDD